MSDYEIARRTILARRLKFLTAALTTLSPHAHADKVGDSTSQQIETELADPEQLKQCLAWNSYAATWAVEVTPEEREQQHAAASSIRREIRGYDAPLEALEQLVRLDRRPQEILLLGRRLIALQRSSDAWLLALRFEASLLPEFADDLAKLRAEAVAQLAVLNLSFANDLEAKAVKTPVNVMLRASTELYKKLPLSSADFPQRLCVDAGTLEIQLPEDPVVDLSVEMTAGSVKSVSLRTPNPNALAMPCLQPLPPLWVPAERRPSGLALGAGLSGIVPRFGEAGATLDLLARLDLNRSDTVRLSFDLFAGAGVTPSTPLFPMGGGFTLRTKLGKDWGMGLAGCGGYVAVVTEERNQLRSSAFVEPRWVLLFLPIGDSKRREILLDLAARFSGYDQAGDARFGLTQIVFGLRWSSVALQFREEPEFASDI